MLCDVPTFKSHQIPAFRKCYPQGPKGTSAEMDVLQIFLGYSCFCVTKKATSCHSVWFRLSFPLISVMYSPQPSNVLLDTDCVVKLCDFGLARSLKQFQEDSCNPALTEYVATRWYRAPEILLGSARYRHHLFHLKQLMITFHYESVSLVQRYTKGVDMWSLGCILGEMLQGKALFPGTSTINQIEKIMSAIPHPSPEGDKMQLKTTDIFTLVHNIRAISFGDAYLSDILAIRSEYGASMIQRMLLK